MVMHGIICLMLYFITQTCVPSWSLGLKVMHAHTTKHVYVAVCATVSLILKLDVKRVSLDAARKQNAICLGNLAVVKHCSACKSLRKNMHILGQYNRDGHTNFPENIKPEGCSLSAFECCISSVCKQISGKYAAHFLMGVASLHIWIHNDTHYITPSPR